MLSFTLGASSITVFLDGVFNTIDSTHANHPLLLAELQKAPADRDLDAIRTYITIKALIEHASIGRVTVFEDEVQFDGRPVHNYMTERMLELLAQGFDIGPWATFMDNVFDNPAPYAIDELYQWLEKAKMPITPDGCFLAFKKVRQNYTDCHTGLFDNSPGSILEMDRDACNPDRHQTCSTGFHFCSIGYLGHFGGQKVMVVKVNPKDVTSIPSDYNFTKGRCCRYEVVGELTKESSAYHGCWNKPLVALEDPAELPKDVVKNITIVPPEASDPDTDQAFEAIEEEQTDAGKFSPFSSHPLRDEACGIQPVAKLPADPKEGIVLGFDWENAPGSKAVVFTTTDGREFSEAVVRQALDDASIRGAARNLGIQDSTLRGWKKKLGL